MTTTVKEFLRQPYPYYFKGNAQGYQLEIKGYSNPLPVSSGMIADFERKIKMI
jgi:hypothetical protein